MGSWLGALWRVANQIKNAWEWYLYVAFVAGLPTAALMIAAFQGQALDVLLLYIMAGIAFGFVFGREMSPVVITLMNKRRAGSPARILNDFIAAGNEIARGIKRVFWLGGLSEETEADLWAPHTKAYSHWRANIAAWLSVYKPESEAEFLRDIPYPPEHEKPADMPVMRYFLLYRIGTLLDRVERIKAEYQKR